MSASNCARSGVMALDGAGAGPGPGTLGALGRVPARRAGVGGRWPRPQGWAFSWQPYPEGRAGPPTGWSEVGEVVDWRGAGATAGAEHGPVVVIVGAAGLLDFPAEVGGEERG